MFADEQSDAAVREASASPRCTRSTGWASCSPPARSRLPGATRTISRCCSRPAARPVCRSSRAHTHAGTTAFLDAFPARRTGRLAPTDVVAIVIPFPHLFGTAILTPRAAQRRLAWSTLPTFELEAFLRDARTTTPSTIVPATPPLVAALARHPLVDRLDLSALRLVIASAAPCAPELQDAVEARLGCVVGDYLGLTEAWCVAPAAEPVGARLGRAGSRRTSRR